jgi:hypothetical protein
MIRKRVVFLVGAILGTAVGFACSLLLVGCGFRYEPTGASGAVEEALLSYTAKHAGELSLRVRGEITDTIAENQKKAGQVDPTGWYSAGVAWYYRTRVRETVSLEPEPGHETADNVAAHEVCRAVSSFHDLIHWQCSAKIAVPTYPRPVAGATLQGACF